MQQASDRVKLIRERLRVSQSRQKNYADNHRRELELQVGDFIFLKVSPWRGAICIKGRGKLSPRYVGPFEVTERIGSCTYRLLLSKELSRIHNVFHVSNLRKYIADPSHVLHTSELEVQENLSYEEMPIKIVDRKEQVLRSKVIPWVKVIWKNHGIKEATCEGEEGMHDRYPHLFNSGTNSIFEDENS